MPMPTCVNHPERAGKYTIKVDGRWVDVCTTCYLEIRGDDEEDEG